MEGLSGYINLSILSENNHCTPLINAHIKLYNLKEKRRLERLMWLYVSDASIVFINRLDHAKHACPDTKLQN